ncbi:MAG: cytochrome d ubiquinol oxidase subunit II [Gemmatimonadota bacterium]
MSDLLAARAQALGLWFGRDTLTATTRALLTNPAAIALQCVTGVAAVTAIGALLTRRYRLARTAAVVQVSGIVWGWGLAQFPALVPGVHTIASAAAPEVTLRLVLIGVAGGMVVLIPSLWYLFKIFKAEPARAFERVDTAEHRLPE